MQTLTEKHRNSGLQHCRAILNSTSLFCRHFETIRLKLTIDKQKCFEFSCFEGFETFISCEIEPSNTCHIFVTRLPIVTFCDNYHVMFPFRALFLIQVIIVKYYTTEVLVRRFWGSTTSPNKLDHFLSTDQKINIAFSMFCFILERGKKFRRTIFRLNLFNV